MAAPAGPAPDTRDGSLINAFEVMCNLEHPDFNRIDAKATAMRMQVGADTVAPSAGGTVTRHKAWVGQLETGPFVLMIDEMSGRRGVSTACAVGGNVADVDVFRSEFTQSTRMPANPTTQEAHDGTHSVLWDGVEGAGTTVILRDFKPSGRSAVLMKLLALRKSS